MVNENMVKSEIKYKIVYVFKNIAHKLNVKSREYTRYAQWQYGWDNVIENDFECWSFAEKILNTSIHNYYDSFKAACDRMWKKCYSFAEQNSLVKVSDWNSFRINQIYSDSFRNLSQINPN